MSFAELVAATNFSFLHGASHGEDMVVRAIELGYPGFGIADRNTVAGVVRAWKALKEGREKAKAQELAFPDFKLVTGARLIFADGTPDIIAYPEDRRGWAQLCQLLSRGNLRANKGDCVLGFDDLLAFQHGLLLIVLPESSRRDGEGIAGRTTILPPSDEAPPSSLLAFPCPPKDRPEPSATGEAATVLALPRRKSRGVLVETLATLRRVAKNRVWLGAAPRFDGRDRLRLARWSKMAADVGVPLIATNDALFARREDRPLQDVLTCIRLGVTVAAAGKALAANGERHLKSGEEMAALFADHPQAISDALAPDLVVVAARERSGGNLIREEFA
jgi:error-prone DNA polymerase